MGHITIHNLDETTLNLLRSQADRHGRSVEDELRDIVAQGVRKPFTPDERIAVANRIRAMTPPGTRPTAEQLIREDRDAR